AQAAATLDNMYPGRVQLGVGTGEALNERPFWNGNWPKWEERMERLTEGTRLIRQMWESTEPFKFEGKYFSSDFYYLYTKPRKKIPIYSSAIGRKEANKTGLGKVAVELVFSFDKPEDIIKNAWKTIGICRKDSWSIPNPVAVEEAGKQVTVNDLHKNMHFCKNWKDVVNVIETYQEVGVNEVTTYTGCDKKQIRAFAKNILSVF